GAQARDGGEIAMPADPKSEYILELENVSKYFGSVIALRDVTVRLRRGEVHCLLGDNGAGKSTLIKILAGCHRPSEGVFKVGGERQCLAIARAIHFGARVLILDEPTAALGVRQSANVLRLIARAREKGISVIFITHNVHHAYPVGDSFTLLNRGRSMGTFRKGEIQRDQVLDMMPGGLEMQKLMAEFG